MTTHSLPALRVMVVDDEQLAREELCYQLEQLGSRDRRRRPATASRRSAPSNGTSPTWSSSTSRCPASSGFEVARRLLEHQDEAPALVFVTAFDQHAIEAFEVNAVDYLLKPVEPAGWNRRSSAPAGG